MYDLISNFPTHSLEMIGGSTESVFTKTEEKLHDIKYQKVIGCFVNKHPKLSSNYRSMVDFIFCEYFTGWKEKCFSFYRGEGKSFKKELSVCEINKYDNFLSEYFLEACLYLPKNYLSFEIIKYLIFLIRNRTKL
jgi:hypothetical protein